MIARRYRPAVKKIMRMKSCSVPVRFEFSPDSISSSVPNFGDFGDKQTANW